MCQVFDKSATGIVTVKAKDEETFCSRYGEALGKRVFAKMLNKRKNASERGIKFRITWEVLDMLIDKLILGIGSCDYTGEQLNKIPGHTNYPSLERIDSSLPYEGGNLCVVTVKSNTLKSYFEDSKSKFIKVDEPDMEVFKKMFSTITNPDKMIGIRNQYIPNKQEKEMTTETNNVTVSAVSSTQADVPEDIQISKVYYTLMNFFINSGKVVNITFAQFRRLYKFKNCFLSGQAMAVDNKSPLLLGDEVNKDTLRFALEDYATPFQTLIDKKGMTPTLLKNMLNKNTK